MWNTSDLQMIKYKITDEVDMPWVAIDVSTRKLYSCRWGDTDHLQVYNMDTFDYLGTHDMLPGVLLPKDIQGGAFYEGEIYLATNIDDAVWKLNLQSGSLERVLSDGYPTHGYEVCLYCTLS